MSGSCARTEILLGQEGLAKLAESHILVAGLGGVGGICAESLCRAGVGELTIVDFDIVEKTDLNRQIIALNSTLNRKKTDVLFSRLKDINPDLEINLINQFIDENLAIEISKDSEINFIADCIDSIACKKTLILSCFKEKKPIISSMGAGGRLDPSQIKISKLNKTFNCSLAREMRRELRSCKSCLNLPVVFSTEQQIKALPHSKKKDSDGIPSGRPRAVNGAISYIPNMFGLMMAGYIIQKILNQ
jgi:tRNA A37 threonylcarbamoyladenosine dehydratase